MAAGKGNSTGTSTGRVLGYAVKYGVKYGPHLVVAARALQGPATAYAGRRLAGRQARRAALAEAATLTAGSTLKVFHEGQEVWVVYAGDRPVSAHPPVGPTLELLVAHADLSLRVSPTQSTGRGSSLLRRSH